MHHDIRVFAGRGARLALLAAALWGCSSDGYGTQPVDQPQVTGPEVDATPALAFTPPALTVKVGDTVSFAFGSVPHNVFFDAATGAPADIDGRNTNVVVTRTFTKAGTFKYNCHVHPGMSGTVTVTGPANAPVPSMFVLRTANGAPLPALTDVFGDGISAVIVNVLADTLFLDGAGGYRQVALFESRENGARFGYYHYFDQGRYTLDAAGLHGISSYLEDVTLEATLGNDTRLRTRQALIPTGSGVDYEFNPGTAPTTGY